MPVAGGGATAPAVTGRGGSARASAACSRDGLIGSARSRKPSASATALAIQTGVLMQLPSANPLAPSGVNGDGVAIWRISGLGTSWTVGTR